MPSVGDPGLPELLEQIVKRLDREVLHGAVLLEGEHAQLPMGGGVEVDRPRRLGARCAWCSGSEGETAS